MRRVTGARLGALLLAGSWLAAIVLAGCQPSPSGPAEAVGRASPMAISTATAVPPTATVTAVPTSPPPAPPTAIATSSSTPTATATATATPSPTATPIGPCSQRVPSDDDLLTMISVDYGISRDYVPGDLVPLADYFPYTITYGYPTEVRAIIVEPLVRLVNDMYAAGLAPTIISGYRSYYSQGVARQKWEQLYPDWVDRISMRPGHSEHQLGTTIDFGSPELAEIVGDETIEFHTYFYKTSEGKWLLDHAHEYGFTLSYPANRLEVTQFFYEPWHYRFIGVDWAVRLKEMGLSLTEYQLQDGQIPCIPDTR